MSSTNEEYVEGIYLNDGTLKKFKDADLTQKVEELNSNCIKYLSNTTDTTTSIDLPLDRNVFHTVQYDGYLTLEVFFSNANGHFMVQFYNEYNICVAHQQINSSQTPTNRHTIWFPMKAGWSYAFIMMKSVNGVHEVYRH